MQAIRDRFDFMAGQMQQDYQPGMYCRVGKVCGGDHQKQPWRMTRGQKNKTLAADRIQKEKPLMQPERVASLLALRTAKLHLRVTQWVQGSIKKRRAYRTLARNKRVGC